MVDEYRKLMGKHYKAVARAEHELFQLAQILCPGDWVFHVIASTEYRGIGDHGVRIDDPVYYAVVTNSDDNVTARGKTVASAVALLVHYLLDGSVFPLTGNNGGRFNLNHWERKIEEAENAARQEGMTAAAKMAYDAAKGATREAIASYVERQARVVEEWHPQQIGTIGALRNMADEIRSGNYSI